MNITASENSMLPVVFEGETQEAEVEELLVSKIGTRGGTGSLYAQISGMVLCIAEHKELVH